MNTWGSVFLDKGGLDSPSNFMGDSSEDHYHWLVVLGRNRDSHDLDNVNWDTALEELGGGGKSVEVVNFGHWAVGWIEYLLVDPDSPEAAIAQDITARLNDYPLLDEEAYCQRRYDHALEIWRDWMSQAERIAIMRKEWFQEIKDFGELRDNVRGCRFSGDPDFILD